MGTQLPSPVPEKGAERPSPIFGPFLLWPNGCIYQYANWYEVGLGLGPRDFMLDGDPAPSLQQGAELPPNFRPMFIVTKRLDGSR